MSSDTKTLEAPEERSGGAARWLKRGCGCGALLFGALVAFVLLLPTILAGPLASVVESGFSDEYMGSLEVGSLELGWKSRQRVEGARLLDPEGGEVGRATVELPSIFDLARSASSYAKKERSEFGRVEIAFDANVVYGADGESNLDRALAPRGPKAAGGGGAGTGGREGPSLRALYDRLGLTLVLEPSEVTVSDPRLGANAAPIRLSGLQGELALTPGEPITLELHGTHDFGSPGPLKLSARVADPSEGAEGLELGSLALSLELDELPYAALAERFGKPDLADDLAALLGPKLALSAGLGGASASGAQRAELGFDTAGLHAEARGTYADGTLAAPAGAPFGKLSGKLSGELLASLAGKYLPEGASLETPPEGAQLALTLDELNVPVHAEDPAAASRVAARLSLGPVTYSAPGLAERGAPLVMKQAELALASRPDAGATIELSTALEGEGEPRLAAKVALGKDWLAALKEKRFGALGLDLSASAKDFPTGVVDALAKQNGLLSDVLGPSLGLQLGVSDVTDQGARLAAGFASKLGTIDARATYRDGALRAVQPDDRLTARVQLSPLLAERVVGPLLPMLVNVQKPAGAAPVELSTSDFVLPLGGDLERVTATLGLSLGEIRYRLLPKLAENLPQEQALAQRTTTLPDYTVKVGKGVAKYEDLPLVIDHKRFDTKGSYDLQAKRFDFDLSLPLANLGGEVAQQLDALRGILPKDLVVPVHLGGTLTSPSLSIDSGFLEKTAKEAAQNALQKEIEKGIEKGAGGDLQKKLEDLLKKPKPKGGG